MAYRIEGQDIVIDGWEKGISDNPYEGINDMRGVNIVSIPGEASVAFSPTNYTFPSCTGNLVSADAGADTVTLSITTGSFAAGSACGGTAVVFSGASLPAGITAGQTYWITYSSNLVFQLSDDCRRNAAINITGNGSGTFTTINMGAIKTFEKNTGVALDKNGRAWDNRSSSPYYSYLGNAVSGTVGLSNTVGNGLIYYKGYLFLFYNSRICYTPYSNSSTGGYFTTQTWVNEWDPTTGAVAVGTAVFNTATGTGNSHEALVSIQDGYVYICDGNYIASLTEKVGQTFNPANTATYTWAKQALPLPNSDIAQCLEELGTYLLIGGQQNLIYPWSKIATDTAPKNPIKIADNFIAHLLTVNTNTYIFAGKRGRIYVTNGSQANQYIKMPDHISGIEPIFTWNNCCYNKNQIYFGISAQNASQSTINSYSGLWAVDITTNSLRVPLLMSNTTADVTAVFANFSTPQGFGLSVACGIASSFPISYSSVSIETTDWQPYTTYKSFIETELIPIGNYLNKKTFENIEFRLSTPLVNGEGIRISYRNYKGGAYTVIGETTTAGALSDYYTVNFDQSQLLQLKIEMKSTNSSPSYVRLREIRLRSLTQ